MPANEGTAATPRAGTVPGVIDIRSAVRALLPLPRGAHLDVANTLHGDRRCAASAAVQTYDSDRILDVLTGTDPVTPCWMCTSMWPVAVANIRSRLFDAPAGEPLTHRGMMAPDWLDVDPAADTSPCCCHPDLSTMHLEHADELNDLIASYRHEQLVAQAATFGAPTAWFAIGRRAMHTATDEGLRELLAAHHPWAGVSSGSWRAAPGLVIFHLPQAALTSQQLALLMPLDERHITPAAGTVVLSLARNVLRDAETRDAAEQALLRDLPRHLEVAHAATH